MNERGWITPDGEFIGSERVVVTMPGELSGHEKAIMDWLQLPLWRGKAQLESELWDYASDEAQRLGIEFLDWSDLAGHGIIKQFFIAKGFKGVAPDED